MSDYGIAKLARGLHVELDVVSGWLEYAALTKKWDRVHNLTAAKNDRELGELLFLDALASKRWVPEGEQRWVDIGAGAGAPAIPLALIHPELHFTLVEPRKKRCAFMRTCVGSLGLAGRVIVREERIDPDDPQVDGAPFDVAISRATFAPEDWLPIGAKLAPKVIVYAGDVAVPEPPDEWSQSETVPYTLPSKGSRRTAALFSKSE